MNRAINSSFTSLRKYSSIQNIKKTCLNELHKKYNGKMVEFAGYEMPVQYENHSVIDSIIHTRNEVSIFDVSHMLQTHIKGNDSVKFIESLTTADVEGMKDNSGALSVFTNDKGGIEDDLIVSKTNKGYLYMVTNAGCIHKDLPYLLNNAEKWRKEGKDVEIEVLENRGLIAVQGPRSSLLLKNETDIDIDDLYFMNTTVGTVFGIPDCRVTRCGYTGEDGFEISVDPTKANLLVERMLVNKNQVNTRLAGLGARDILRLEAGLCLYGNDINESTTPMEGNISFVVAKRRRETLGFPGAEKIVKQLQEKKCPKKRVGFIAEAGRAPRSHIPIVDPLDKACIGFITSGAPSPIVGKNISMGYIDFADAKVGKTVLADFGKKQIKITVSKMPFVKTNYYLPPKK
uniref:Aminomethyltransferase n=1 Tax=Parastrongyloides trichosuri TaxID=131310 RepID=A0A0N4Z0L9_PARTI